MEKLLTIIIPTYNMEKYLNQCLDSLLTEKAQGLLDILVVIDGSIQKRSALSTRRTAITGPASIAGFLKAVASM